MFGIGFSELIVIGIILIVAVGPNRMPGMLKAVVKAYREFRRATRELRASTGIDEILQDEDLRALKKPLYVPPAAPIGKPAPKRTLGYGERQQESPREGVDIATAREVDASPSPEEAARIRARKEAAADEEERVIAAKWAEAEDADRVRAAKLAALGEVDDEEGERIRAAKIAAARGPELEAEHPMPEGKE